MATKPKTATVGIYTAIQQDFPGVLFIPLGKRPRANATDKAWKAAKIPADPKHIKRWFPEYTITDRIGAALVWENNFAVEVIERLAKAGHLIGIVLMSVDVAMIEFDKPDLWPYFPGYLRDRLGIEPHYVPSRRDGHKHVLIALDVTEPRDGLACGSGQPISYGGHHVADFKYKNAFAPMYHPNAWLGALRNAHKQPRVPPLPALGLPVYRSTSVSPEKRAAEIKRAVDAIYNAPPETGYAAARDATWRLSGLQMLPGECQEVRAAYVARDPTDPGRRKRFDDLFDGAIEKRAAGAGLGGTAQVTYSALDAILRPHVEFRRNIRADSIEVRLLSDGLISPLITEQASGKWVEIFDDFVTHIRSGIEDTWTMELGGGKKPWQMGVHKFREGVHRNARLNPVDPFLEWIASVQWDGTDRLDNWLERIYTFTGHEVDVDPKEYAKLVRWGSRTVLMSAVERALWPGSKVDTTVVLRSSVGNYKSTVFEHLFPDDYRTDWFRDDIDLQNTKPKEIMEQLGSCVIAEIADMKGAKEKPVEYINAFMTKKSERARASYAHFATTQRRAFVFVGTCNPSTKIKAPDGNRRFVPLDIQAAELETKEETVLAVTGERDQLWAEALHRVKAGERSMISRDLIPTMLAACAVMVTSDPLCELIESHTWLLPSYTIYEVAEQIGMLNRTLLHDGRAVLVTEDKGRLNMSESKRVGFGLQDAKWTKTRQRFRANGERENRWIPPNWDIKEAIERTKEILADPSKKPIVDQIHDEAEKEADTAREEARKAEARLDGAKRGLHSI